MSDYISRADAIEAVKDTILKRFNLADWYEEMLNCGVEIEDRIKALPSAEAVQGEWEFVDNEIFAGEYFCSICGKRAEVDLYGEWILSNYCGHCGARMKGGDDE